MVTLSIWFRYYLHITVAVQNASDSEWEGMLTECFAVPAVFTVLPNSGGLWLQKQ